VLGSVCQQERPQEVGAEDPEPTPGEEPEGGVEGADAELVAGPEARGYVAVIVRPDLKLVGLVAFFDKVGVQLKTAVVEEAGESFPVSEAARMSSASLEPEEIIDSCFPNHSFEAATIGAKGSFRLG
jgi:hypothetical protein